MLLAKRAGVLDWPEGAGRDAVLRAIDSVIAEMEMGLFSDYASE